MELDGNRRWKTVFYLLAAKLQASYYLFPSGCVCAVERGECFYVVAVGGVWQEVLDDEVGERGGGWGGGGERLVSQGKGSKVYPVLQVDDMVTLLSSKPGH